MGYVIKPMISGPTPSGTEWKPLLPPTYFLASIIVMVGLDILLPGARVLSFPLTLAGLAPMIVGGALNVAADRAFKRNKTTVKPFEVSTSLVTEGVFRVSRNPMYLGMILILLGIALLLGALTPFVACAAFALLMRERFVRVEERMLAEQLGPEWRRYSGQVRRWF
jgi:protein-S-isoprenylcysteine O-methyltransferase Ste14